MLPHILSSVVVRQTRRPFIPDPPEDIVVGDLTITASRTTANKEYRSDSAGFHLIPSTLPTGFTLRDVTCIWTWGDEQGFHKLIDDINCAFRVYGDGSTSYECIVNLRVVDNVTGNVLDIDGTSLGSVSEAVSGQITLTVTDNSSAEVWTVTKSGNEIQATNGTTTYYANSSTGNDSTGNGSSGTPWRYLSRIVEAARANNQVWVINSSDTIPTNNFGFGSNRTNFEICAGIGHTPIFDFQNVSTFSNRYSWSGTSSDIRIVGIDSTTSLDADGGLLSNGGDTQSHIAVFDSDNIKCGYNGFNFSGLTTGLYFHNSGLRVREYLSIWGGQSEYVSFVNSNTYQDGTYGESPQSFLRIYNTRRFNVRGGAHEKRNGLGPLWRMMTGANDGWIDDGRSLCDWLSWKDGLFIAAPANGTTNVTVFAFNHDLDTGSNAGKYNNILISGCDYYRQTSLVGSMMAADGGTVSVDNIVMRNNRGGNDNGDGVTAQDNSSPFGFGNPTRDRFTIVNNDAITIVYRSAWTGFIYQGLISLTGSTATNGAIHNNLGISNSYSENDSPLLNVGSNVSDFSGNSWIIAPIYGSSASTKTAFSSSSQGVQTRVQWLGSALGEDDEGYDFTESQLRDTHYNFTEYRLRDGSSLVDTCTRSPFCRYDYRGYLRGTITTPGRYDPSAVEETLTV